MIRLTPRYLPLAQPYYIPPAHIIHMRRPGGSTEMWVQGYDSCLQICETPTQIAALCEAWELRQELARGSLPSGPLRISSIGLTKAGEFELETFTLSAPRPAEQTLSTEK